MPSFRDSEQLELKVMDMQLLDNLLEGTSKAINLKIKVDEMTEAEMQELITLIKTNPGKQSFSVRLIDQDNRLA